MLNLSRILAAVTAVTEGRAPTVTAKSAPLLACTAVTAVTAENSKGATQPTTNQQDETPDPETFSRIPRFNRNNRNNRTPINHAGLAVTEVEPLTVTTVTKHRVWRVRLSDGTALAAVRPEGATYHEMLDACRWQFGAARVVSVEPTL